MKEASGELSMTAIAVVAIAAIGVLFGTFIFPNIRNSIQRQQLCSAAYGCTCGTANADPTCSCWADVSVADAAGGAGTISQTQISCDNPNN